jgi:pyridoxal/pyridoxine/pyridoxamine kinase
MLPIADIVTPNQFELEYLAGRMTGTAPPPVTITLTFNARNSAAISAKRSLRPSAQRRTIATLRPSIQPTSLNR